MFVFKRNQIIITVLVFMIAIAAYLNIKEPATSVTPNVVNNTADATLDVADNDFFSQFTDKESIDTLPPDDMDNAQSAMKQTEEVAVATDAAQVAKETPATTPQATTETTPVATPNDKVTSATNQVETIQAVITKKNVENLNDTSVPASKTMEVSYFVEEKMLREQSRAAQVEQLTQYVANENLDKESKSKAAQNLLVIQQRIEKESSAESLLRAKGFKDVFVRMDEETVDVVINKAELTDEEIAQIEEIVHRKTGYGVGQIRITPLNGNATASENQEDKATATK